MTMNAKQEFLSFPRRLHGLKTLKTRATGKVPQFRDSTADATLRAQEF